MLTLASNENCFFDMAGVVDFNGQVGLYQTYVVFKNKFSLHEGFTAY